tara:strand:+ start:578 stop:784 length:207 start_codon:yes stop_codon:yes gene_type:complete
MKPGDLVSYLPLECLVASGTERWIAEKLVALGLGVVIGVDSNGDLKVFWFSDPVEWSWASPELVEVRK